MVFLYSIQSTLQETLLKNMLGWYWRFRNFEFPWICLFGDAFTDSTMGLITIWENIFWVTFSIRIQQANLRSAMSKVFYVFIKGPELCQDMGCTLNLPPPQTRMPECTFSLGFPLKQYNVSLVLFDCSWMGWLKPVEPRKKKNIGYFPLLYLLFNDGMLISWFMKETPQNWGNISSPESTLNNRAHRIRLLTETEIFFHGHLKDLPAFRFGDDWTP